MWLHSIISDVVEIAVAGDPNDNDWTYAASLSMGGRAGGPQSTFVYSIETGVVSNLFHGDVDFVCLFKIQRSYYWFP